MSDTTKNTPKTRTQQLREAMLRGHAQLAWRGVEAALDAACDSGLLSLEGFQKIRTLVQAELDPEGSAFTEEN